MANPTGRLLNRFSRDLNQVNHVVYTKDHSRACLGKMIALSNETLHKASLKACGFLVCLCFVDIARHGTIFIYNVYTYICMAAPVGGCDAADAVRSDLLDVYDARRRLGDDRGYLTALRPRCDGPQTKRHGRFLSSPFLFVVACVLSLSWKTVFFHICFRISHSLFV